MAQGQVGALKAWAGNQPARAATKGDARIGFAAGEAGSRIHRLGCETLGNTAASRGPERSLKEKRPAPAVLARHG
jgi:hypothetical protein